VPRNDGRGWRRSSLGVIAAATLLALLSVASAEAVVPASLPGGFTQIQQGPNGGSVWQGRIPNTYVPRASRPTVVYLPPNFNPQSRYPVIYLLQGFRGSPYQFVFGLDLAGRADRLIAAHATPPFVAVMPPAGLTVRVDGEWTGDWEKYLVRDVVPWVDSHLATDSSAQGRVVAGLSAGGYGAVDIGLRHPGLFGTLESWSGSFTAPHDGSLAGASASELQAHDPTLLVWREAPLLGRLRTRFFLSCGTRDRITALGTETFARELSSLRVAHRLWLGPGGHDGRFWSSQLTPALTYAFPAADRAQA
jgi:enterochelin esterase-like enzyme